MGIESPGTPQSVSMSLPQSSFADAVKETSRLSPVIVSPIRSKLSFPSTLVLIGIVVIGTLIRCHRLSEISFWFDESFCWKMTTFGWGELWDRVARDNHPPLYFVLLKLWIGAFGATAAAMRSLSIVCGVLTILGAFVLVREIEHGLAKTDAASSSKDVAALVAAGLVALSPAQVDWSQQVRMYALASALTMWSSWFLMRTIASPPRAGRMEVGYVLTATALAYTHYYGLFVLAAQFLFAIGCCCWGPRVLETSRRTGVVRCLLLFLIVGILWSPWLPKFLTHRQQVDASFWTNPLVAQDVVRACFRMWVAERNEQLPKSQWAWGLAAATFSIWLAQLIAGRRGLRLLALAPLVTFGLAIIASVLGRNIVSPRYFLMVQGLALCGLAVSLQRIPWMWLRGLSFTGLLLVTSWLCFEYTQRRDEFSTRPGFELAVAFLDEGRSPGELVLVANPMVQITVATYVQDQGTVYVVGDGSHFPHYYGTAVMRDAEYLSVESISQLTTSRIWTIDVMNWTGGTWQVALPHPWVDVREESFYDWYSPHCQIVVRECVRRRSAAIERTD